MFTYSPPASIDDLSGRPSKPTFLANWHIYINQNFHDNIGALGDDPLFFSETDTPAQSGPVPIPWNGFPLSLTRQFKNRTDAWKAADTLQTTNRYTPKGSASVVTMFRPQDEYCEWFAYTTASKITRIVFTAEGPEYWIKLAESDFSVVLSLYQQFVNPGVTANDLRLSHDLQFGDVLLQAGSYDPFNKWNTTNGVMHLTHPANTLGAEINLAAFATIPREDTPGARVSDVRRLICCAGYGNANRSSDPSIGFAVNTTCVPLTAGSAIMTATLADPVGLYMNQLQAGVLTGPNGEALDNWFQFVRGNAGKGLMAVVEPPSGSAFGLDRVLVKGVPLQRGGQIAEAIDMVLYAKVASHAGPAPSLQACTNVCCMPAGTPAASIKNINLAQPNGACKSPSVPAYPELLEPAAHAALLAEVALASSVQKRKLRSRLDG